MQIFSEHSYSVHLVYIDIDSPDLAFKRIDQRIVSLGHDVDRGKVLFRLEEAHRLWMKAAKIGHAKSQHNLGVLYSKGKGCKKDLVKALKWFLLSSEQGIAQSQNNLGNMYFKGEGVERDFKAALKWYRQAAEQGNLKAQTSLGFMYGRGEGVKRDYDIALKWYRLAAVQGSDFAKDAIEEIERRAWIMNIPQKSSVK